MKRLVLAVVMIVALSGASVVSAFSGDATLASIPPIDAAVATADMGSEGITAGAALSAFGAQAGVSTFGVGAALSAIAVGPDPE